MKYHVDTIPVWDAYKAESECPLCDLRERSESDYVDSFLGASVMEPGVRLEVNEKGFCGPHFRLMFERQNRLGLALMTHTHLQDAIRALPSAAGQKRRLGKPAPGPKGADADTCILCDRLRATMQRYLYTTLHLWKTDSAFRAAFEASKGLCLPHLRQLFAMAPEHLGRQAADFLSTLERIERENLDRIEKELEWFTLKFDYRNADAPWGNSKDALERAINKLRGKHV